MTSEARQLLIDVLALPEKERAEIASELLASLDGPPDSDWEATWLTELDRRREAAGQSGDRGDDWTKVRARLLRDVG